MRWVVVVVAAGCSGSPAPAPAPPKPPAVVEQWSVRVAAPEGVADFNFLTVEYVVAGRGAHPVMFANALFDTDKPVTTARTDPPKPAYDELIGVELGADATTVTTVSGVRRVIPYTAAPRDSIWLDLAPGVLALAKSPTGARFARFDTGATPAWVAEIADPAIRAVRRIDRFADGDPLIAIDRQSGGAGLVRIDLATGGATTIATVPEGRVALAEGASRVAVVFPKQTAGCTTCESVEVYDLAGKRIGGFALPHPGDRTVGDPAAMSLGFDGRLLWMYEYDPGHRNHGFGGREGCGYEVYDVASGKRVRSLADAGGEWAKLTKNCAVRALLPTPDGGAIAFVVLGVREARVVKLAAPP
jgi:hypothetical protein